MAIWEIRIVRFVEQRRDSDGKRRTVGRYQVYHDGVAQPHPLLSGATAESRGPGANAPKGNGRRVEPGRYPLWTQNGTKYKTIDYSPSLNQASIPRPGIELGNTAERKEILIHPGIGFLASIGCINLCSSLPHANEPIDYAGSRQRVIAVIDDMRAFLHSHFPTQNGKAITDAFAVIDGEPAF
ncbi:hypothetical protein [Ancylobacter sp. G4_0304]|uniref:hypothetical protein n=1 Tax=Ancylobacter sp. G4_0304 TaxID=3114289 RepID=UPI0039C6B3FA